MIFLYEKPALTGERILRREFESTIEAKDEFLDDALDALYARAGLPPHRALDARLVLDELIGNSMIHGNQYDRAKRIVVTLYAEQGGWVATVEDEGEGFSPDDVCTDFDAISLMQVSGRGLALVEMYSEELSFYNGGTGACVRCSIGEVAWAR